MSIQCRYNGCRSDLKSQRNNVYLTLSYGDDIDNVISTLFYHWESCADPVRIFNLLSVLNLKVTSNVDSTFNQRNFARRVTALD